jgi:MFS family permease
MSLSNEGNQLEFYKDSSKGRVLRAMTLSDISYWGADAFIGVIIVLFAIQFIHGGSATHVGLAYFLYRAVAAIASIPIGRFYDKHPGYLDEVWGLASASFLAGAVYIGLSFSTELWQLYLAMFLLGLTNVMDLLSWSKLFYHNIEKKDYGQTVGVYRAILSICQGAAVALGGLVGDSLGFDKVVFFGGIVVAFGAFFPLSIRYVFVKKS